MNVADLAALTSPGGAALLQRLTAEGAADADALTLGQRLRIEGHEPALVAAVMTQLRLRSRAAVKFGDRAGELLFTPAGAEQATRAVVARRHAQRFVDAGVTRVADLGCGVGADSLAFLDAGLPVLAVDADPVTAAVAAHNLTAHDLTAHTLAGPGAEVRCDDVTAGVVGDLDPTDGAWFDPARRTGSGRRVFDPEATSPPLSFVLATAARVPATGAKLAPGLPHDLLPPVTEAEWTSVDGDVVECALWCGPLARAGVARAATVLTRGAVHRLDTRDAADAEVGAVGGFLHEPDGAVIRAGLVGAVAAGLDGRLLDETIAYVSTDSPARSPFTSSYAVLDVLPFGLKPLRAFLRSRDVGPLTVKKRGTAVEPEMLRRQLGLKGSRTATIVLTRIRGKQSVLLVEPRPTSG